MSLGAWNGKYLVESKIWIYLFAPNQIRFDCFPWKVKIQQIKWNVEHIFLNEIEVQWISILWFILCACSKMKIDKLFSDIELRAKSREIGH